jgi:hypothetical protein
MAKPRERALDDPPPATPPQFPAALMRRPLVVTPCRDHRVDAAPSQARPPRVAIVAALCNHAVGPLAGASRRPRPPDRGHVEGPLEEGNRRRGRRDQVCSPRSTRALDQNHPLRALAPLGGADFGAPLFAGVTLPSAKHSSQRICSWSWSWANKARQSLSRMPASSQYLSRRQQVLGLPYCRGNSLHGAPVHRIHRMPSTQRRSSKRGRPPRGGALGWWRWTRMASQGVFVSPRHAMNRPPCWRGDSWRYDTLTGRF